MTTLGPLLTRLGITTTLTPLLLGLGIQTTLAPLVIGLGISTTLAPLVIGEPVIEVGYYRWIVLVGAYSYSIRYPRKS
jgi:hypothetical protein